MKNHRFILLSSVILVSNLLATTDTIKQKVFLMSNRGEFFPELVKQIRASQKSIYIQMFIWRDDAIGNIIGREILQAADRGVKITISKDLLGAIHERSEENKQSFFHKKNIPLKIRFIENILKFMYPKQGIKGNQKQIYNDLAYEILNHENIVVKRDAVQSNHSKYFLFDNSVLICGGVNIENKEIDHDINGLIYHDYMVKVTDKTLIASFLERISNKKAYNNKEYFEVIHNNREMNHFDCKKIFLQQIQSAQKTIEIQNAYLGDADIIKNLIKAVEKGIDVTIFVSESSNLQNNMNKKVLDDLLKKTKNKININLVKVMLHAKTMFIDNQNLIIGSSNLNKYSEKNTEINLQFSNNYPELIERYIELTNFLRSNSEAIRTSDDLKYNKFIAILESWFT